MINLLTYHLPYRPKFLFYLFIFVVF